MRLFFVWLLGLAAFAIWAPIFVGLIARLLWPQISILTRESPRGAEPAPQTPRDPGGTHEEFTEVASWEPGLNESGFPKLDDAPLDS